MAKTVLELTMVLRLALNLFVFLLLLAPCAVIIGLCHYLYTDNSFFVFSFVIPDMDPRALYILGPPSYISVLPEIF